MGPAVQSFSAVFISRTHWLLFIHYQVTKHPSILQEQRELVQALKSPAELDISGP